MKHKAKYHEIYYKDIHIDRRTLTVWGWYNFDEGYGVIKSYVFDHRHAGRTMRTDAVERFNPRVADLVEVAASKDDVHGIIEWAIRVTNNAGKTWGECEGGAEAFYSGGRLKND